MGRLAGQVLTRDHTLATEVEPVPAASVLLLRDDPLEVLMILRHEHSSFVPNTWVFPGGAVDPADGPAGTIDTMRRAAIREVKEETGVDVTGDLVWTSRWITPAGMPKRFDTWFFLTAVERNVAITLQETEAVDYQWIKPAVALEHHRRGELPMVFPTIRNLEAIADYDRVEHLLAARRGAKIEPVQPRLVIDGDRKKIVLP